MLRKIKRLSLFIFAVFLLQSILIPAVSATEIDDIVLELSIPEKVLINNEIKEDTMPLSTTDSAITLDGKNIKEPKDMYKDKLIKNENPDFETDRFIVKYKNKQNDYISLEKKQKLKDFTEKLRKGTKESDIEYIQPDYILNLSSDDPYYSSQWGLENNSLPEVNTSSSSIKEGIQRLHPRIKEAINGSQEFKNFLLGAIPGENLRQRLLSGDVPGDVAPHILMELAYTPSLMEEEDISKNEEIYLCDAQVSEAWNISTGRGITVAIIDTGVDITHEDLAQNIWVNTGEIPNNGIDDDGNGKIDDVNGWNFSDDNNTVYDASDMQNENHGTHIAGIIAAVKDNGKGIAGVAPAAKVMPIKVFKNGMAYTSDIIKAIEYAEKMGAKIVNCSWGSSADNIALKEAIQNSNMLFVAATGNGSSNIDSDPLYPAAFDCSNIISVASINPYGSLSGFSNYGESSVDVAAPGEAIQSTFIDNTYGENSGTSMAAAFVSGGAALVLEGTGTISVTELKDRILQSSDCLSSLTGKVNGSEKINCENAVNNLLCNEIKNIENKATKQSSGSTTEDTGEFSLLSAETSVKGQFIKVVGGSYHSLALRSDGTIWACGENSYGKLGDGTTINRASPVKVSGLGGMTDISAGYSHSLALKSDGSVWAWGANGSGQLGDGTKTTRLTPVQVTGLSDVDLALI